MLALKFACDASYYYLYGAPLIHVYTDCISLEGIFDKPLGDIKNRRIRDMVEKLMGFNFKFHYVPAEENKILDCFSRLTREIREAEHFEVSDSVLADHSLINKIKKVSLKKNAQENDPSQTRSI